MGDQVRQVIKFLLQQVVGARKAGTHSARDRMQLKRRGRSYFVVLLF